MASKKESTTLPHKEAGIFKRMVRSYEQKQYKPGLKLAKQILSAPKCADHGETLAMKGLILNCLGKKEEAYENVKRGLKNDVRSYLCWHVYGLLHRSDRKYEQAISAYLNALRIDEKNMQILRDLSTLQIHMRDLEGFKQTRFRMVSIKPAQPVNWISLAIANHMMGDLQLAYRTLEEYRSNSTPNSNNENGTSANADLEYAEVILYQVELLLDMGQYDEALNHFGKHQSFVVDKMAALELKGQALRKLNRVGEAKTVYMEMLKRNPYNRDIIQALLSLEKFANESEKLNFISKLRAEFPESRQLAMLPLFELTGDNFRQHFLEAAKNSFIKGVPAFFADIKPLYSRHNDSAEKISIIGETMLSYYQKISSEPPTASNNNDFSAGDSAHAADSDVINGDRPRCIMRLWATLFLAQHYDKIGNFNEALKYADESIEIAPTLLEALCVKARILKHLGRNDDAVAVVDAAQQLDTADRYLNYKCAKYLLRANRIRDAEKLMSNFPREGTKTEENQLEMQAYWYLYEKTQALFRLQMYGDALRICQHAARIFNDMIEDQFDFHLYCLRKFTVRSYIRMLQEADRIHANRFYLKFTSIAVTIYMLLLDGKLITKRDNEVLDESLLVFPPIDDEKAVDADENKENMPNGSYSGFLLSSSHTLSQAELLERYKQERDALLQAKKPSANANSSATEQNSSSSADQKSTDNKENKNTDSKTGVHHNKKHQQVNNSTNKDDDDAVGNAPPVDYDPQELLNAKDPLEEAYKFVKPLLSLDRIDDVQTLRLTFEVCRRKKQIPAMLRCLRMLEQHKSVLPSNVFLQLWRQFEQLREQSVDQLVDPLHTIVLEARPSSDLTSSTAPPPNSSSSTDAVEECAARIRSLVFNRTFSHQQEQQQKYSAAPIQQLNLLRTATSRSSSKNNSRTSSLSVAAAHHQTNSSNSGGGGEPGAMANGIISGKLNSVTTTAHQQQPSKQQQLYMSATQQQQPNGVL